MFQGRRIAVVIPARDERLLVGRTIATLPDFIDDIVVVDDGSSDETAERARAAAWGRRGFWLLRHEEPLGVGAALRTGYAFALSLPADITVVVGADAQMDPRDMAGLVTRVVGGADYAKGDRLASRGGWRRIPAIRLLGNLALSWVTRWFLGGRRLSDAQCGYTAISATALRRLDLAEMHTGYGYPNDLLLRLHEAGLSVVDVPVRAIYAHERSRLVVSRVWMPVVGIFLRAAMRRLRRRLGGAFVVPRPVG